MWVTFRLTNTPLTFPRPAYAYLDPGTGSYILQLIMAGLLGAAFAVKLFWKDIRIFFKNLFSREEEHEETEE
jgi:hypothetical protein